ncbi:unnamed protein product [Adineta steineri]|uniref:Uncharacterized protein n=1 Tax=Adineta steineri TaxID=433720 RepID=A0A819PAU7_9BILA|nr:unnamed protein product [Adineta steineri]CAF4011318.1 unnamed protein product [Adineta steineri]
MVDFLTRQFKKQNSYEQFNYDTNKNYKSKLDLIRLSAVVCGIEFCYAAETAFVSPILLQIGLPVIFMTWTWCLSPLIGFFLVPALGSLSDKCHTRFGRRRPFIFFYSIGILLGLLLVANGRTMGEWFGDKKNEAMTTKQLYNSTKIESQRIPNSLSSYKYGTTLTVLGVLLLDLDCDACQSPSRAYLLDVASPSQHASGLTTFTFMAGFGGCLGYFLGGIPWEHTFFASILGDHIHVVFTLVWIIYMICMILTLTAEKEPTEITSVASNLIRSTSRQYIVASENIYNEDDDNKVDIEISYCDYIRSIIYMPSALRWLCLTNFFSWMALVSYSLFFTDFVGQAVFGGDPKLEYNHPLRLIYNDGVRFGSWGMSIYSISCSIYSYNIESLNNYFGIKRVYIGSQLIYAIGMLLMGYVKHRIGVIVLSAVAGILYSTLFTIPYLLIAKYHTLNTFGRDGQVRGIGTDVAVISSMVFLAQLCLSSTMGTFIHLSGSTVVITVVASLLSVCSAISATQVLYI